MVKYYKVLGKYVGLTFLTRQDTESIWVNVGETLKFDGKSIFIFHNDKWVESIETPNYIDILLERKDIEEILDK